MIQFVNYKELRMNSRQYPVDSEIIYGLYSQIGSPTAGWATQVTEASTGRQAEAGAAIDHDAYLHMAYVLHLGR